MGRGEIILKMSRMGHQRSARSLRSTRVRVLRCGREDIALVSTSEVVTSVKQKIVGTEKSLLGAEPLAITSKPIATPEAEP